MKRIFAALALLLLAAIVLIVGLLPVFDMSPYVIDVEEHGVTVDIQYSPRVVFFPNDCVLINWDVQFIKAIYYNDRGTSGTRERELCGTTVFRVVAQDDTELTYVVNPEIFIQQVHNQRMFVTVGLLVLAALAVAGGFGSVAQWRTDARAFRQSVVQFWRDVRSSGRIHLLLLALIVIGGLVLRALLITREVHIDEAESFNHYTINLYDAISHYDDPNNHLLNTIFLFFNRSLFGVDRVLMRWHVFVAGMVTLVASYAMGRVFYNKHVGLLTAAFVSIASIMLMYSTYARGYMLQTVFFMGMVLLARYLSVRENKVAWLLFALLAVLAFISLPTTVYIYVGLGLWFLWAFFGKWQQYFSLFSFSVLAGMLTLACYAPTLMRWGLRPIIANQYVERYSDPEFFQTYLPTMLERFLLNPWFDLPLAAQWVMAGLVIVGVFGHWALRNQKVPPMTLVITLTSLAIVVFIQQTIPYPRVWTYLTPLFLMQAAVAVVWLLQRFPSVMLGVSLVLVLLCTVLTLPAIVTERQYHDYENFMPELHALLESPDQQRILSYNPVTEMFAYYFRRDDIPLEFLSVVDFESAQDIYLLTDRQHTFRTLERLTGYTSANTALIPVAWEGHLRLFRVVHTP